MGLLVGEVVGAAWYEKHVINIGKYFQKTSPDGMVVGLLVGEDEGAEEYDKQAIYYLWGYIFLNRTHRVHSEDGLPFNDIHKEYVEIVYWLTTHMIIIQYGYVWSHRVQYGIFV